MNRYRITALEDVDVCVSDEHQTTVLVGGATRRVTTQSTPHWRHLDRGEACEVAALHGIRGDFFEAGAVTLPAAATAPVVLHDALRIEGLPTPPLQHPTPSHP